MSGKSDKMKREASGLSSVPIWVHVAIIAVIVAVVTFSVYKLLKWNAGTVKTQGVVEGNFEVEVLDQVFLLDRKSVV